ncbi:clathrin interactor 1a [Alosa pseudoharengus]|uniref:clathrin interactor 1a n=1 Tax=Alosa pseudoharengus TaxID=34774 RepID=UPI003F8AF302
MLNMWKVRELVDKATNVVMNYTEIESKVREATNDDPWGPSGQLMGEIARATFMYEQFPEVMNMLWNRMLKDNKKNWRRVYKSLLLLAYLIKNGSERVVTSSREHLYDLRSIESYHCIDENGKDQGINVRQKVKEMTELVQDDERLREERKKAKKNKDKYIGVSSDSMGSYRGYADESDGKGRRWDSDWEQKGAFPFSEKVGEISGRIGSSIEDAVSRFRNKPRDDSPDRFSDTEEERGRGQQNGQSSRGEFKDEEETVTTKSVQIVQATETTATRKRGGVPSKKVDLGAAAGYTGDSSPAHSTSSTSSKKPEAPSQSGAGLVDLFTVEATPTQAAPTSTDLFADFSSATASASLPSAPVSSSDFGGWNAFPDGAPPTSGVDLFGSAPVTSDPVMSAPASSELFDLFSPAPQSASLSASQSIAFSMATNSSNLPQSQSQPLSLGDPLVPQAMGQKAGVLQGPKAGGVPTTWSDSNINISLDLLSPTPPKPQQPTLSMMQHGVQQAPVGMVTQGFAGMNLGMQGSGAIRAPGNPMMPGTGVAMGMPTMGMMGMNMSMGMPGNMGMGLPGNMGMGLPGNMGMGMGTMGMGATPAAKPDAFADFANFK